MWNETKELIKLGLPMAVTQFFIMAMGFLDTAMAGNYASVDLAGVALGGNILWPVFMLVSGLNMALTPMSAQLRGEGRIAAIGPLVRQGLWLALIASVITVAIMLNARPIFSLFNVDAEAAEIGVRYLDAAAWGIPPILMYVTLRYVCEGLGHTLEPMIIVGTTLIVNGVLNYMFIYGKFGLPEMGGEGCGWATAISMWVEFILILGLLSRPWLRETELASRFEWLHFENLISILKVGLPIGVTIFLEMAVFSIVGFLVGSLGVTALAAHSIAGNINWATFVIPMSLGSAISIRIGFFVGARDFKHAMRIAKLSFQISLGYAMLTSLVLISGRHVITGLYSNDPVVLQLAASLLIIVAIYQIVDCPQATMVGALRGYKDTRIPAIYSFVGYWVLALPLGLVLGYGYIGEPMGVYGFWLGLGLGLFVVSLLAGRRLYLTSQDDERILKFAQI
ncbi:MAG TPA: MATE family efflux transporter [Pseudomonadales bacterium]|nr:MATE family efflux transporter [Pseudomonadales bacterium]